MVPQGGEAMLDFLTLWLKAVWAFGDEDEGPERGPMIDPDGVT